MTLTAPVEGHPVNYSPVDPIQGCWSGRATDLMDVRVTACVTVVNRWVTSSGELLHGDGERRTVVKTQCKAGLSDKKQGTELNMYFGWTKKITRQYKYFQIVPKIH